MHETNYEISQSNSKKRVRASQACVHCRKKKIRCDEIRPNCTQCQEAKVVCEYSEPKKRGPRKGYVQLLEERLAQMERKLMGPGTNGASDDDNNSISSASMKTKSPLQLYDNPDITADLPPLDIVMHLVDLFFKNVNSIFPFVHRAILRRSIQDGSISRPLLYSVLAISARFSDNPAIRTNPPYLAGERYAEKALSLVNADILVPTLANIQFWGIMSCLEYGRASGSKSWIYGGLAVRFCQELGYYKEETMTLPILAEDGSIDTLAMALRRRVFWSCLCVDKLSSAGTHRPQCIERSDCDTSKTSITECITLRDPSFHKTVDGKPITDDSLLNITKYYMSCVENYGEANRYMNRAKSNSASIVWPPIAEFRNLDRQLRAWKDGLPESFQFNQKNLDHHREYASGNYLNVWLSSHAIWCSSMMILNRAALAFSDIKVTEIQEDLYRRIQQSIDTCRMCVDAAMGIFGAMKDLCGHNTLPYMCYSAYVFATVLMTSTFSSTPEACRKSSRGLRVLYDLIDGLRPYWPMCERLADATRELLVAHQRLYQEPGGEKSNNIQYHTADVRLSHSSRQSMPSGSSHGSMSSPVNSNAMKETLPLSALLGQTTTDDSIASPYSQQQQQQQGSPYNKTHYMPSPPSVNITATTSIYDQQRQNTALSSTYSNWNRGNEIDFNSLEFLYDTGLFGQVVFDVNNNNTSSAANAGAYPQQQPLYQNFASQQQQAFVNTTSANISSPTATTTNTPVSAFQNMIQQTQQQQQNSSPNNNFSSTTSKLL